MDVASFTRCVGNCYGSSAFGHKFPIVSLSCSFSRKSQRRLSFLRPIMVTNEPISSKSSECYGTTPVIGETKQMINGKQENIVWHDCSITKSDRQELINQKGCVIWITGLSGSGKSTLACALSRALHNRGKLSYVLDGDNVRHGLNSDLSFKAEDRVLRRLCYKTTETKTLPLHVHHLFLNWQRLLSLTWTKMDTSSLKKKHPTKPHLDMIYIRPKKKGYDLYISCKL